MLLKPDLSSQTTIRQPGITKANNAEIESSRHGGAFFGVIHFEILPSKYLDLKFLEKTLISYLSTHVA